MRLSRQPVAAWSLVIALLGGAIAPACAAPQPVARAAVAAEIFPLRTEPGRRYLIDAQGKPFLIHGDAAWGTITQLRREEVERFLDERQRRGFNTIIVELVEHHFSRNTPRNAYGVEPFKVPGDFSTPNEPYFAHADYVISSARRHGMLVLLAPAYMGYEGKEEGWYQEMKANGPAKLRGWGRYVAERFRQHDNILWVNGGDFVPPEKDLLRAVAQGIQDVTPAALQTYHGSRGTSALGVLGTSESWLNVNVTYTDEHTVVEKSLAEYRRSTLPFFLIEARYEGAWHATDWTVRLQAYQSLLSGSAGQVMGNDPLWMTGPGWEQQLDNLGARSMVHLRALFDSLRWWTLQPDLDATLLTMGAGSGIHAAAARAADGTFALIYTPSVRTLAVDLSRLAGPRVRGRWFDPAAGVYVPIAGSPWAARGTRIFVPAGANSRGQEDWVLVLESVREAAK